MEKLNTKKVIDNILTGKLKDSDGDKFPDVFDCKPYNPKKQAFWHDWAKRQKPTTVFEDLDRGVEAPVTEQPKRKSILRVVFENYVQKERQKRKLQDELIRTAREKAIIQFQKEKLRRMKQKDLEHIYKYGRLPGGVPSSVMLQDKGVSFAQKVGFEPPVVKPIVRQPIRERVGVAREIDIRDKIY